jgi:predicted DNA-binding protein (UPF0251 family)
MSKRLLLAAGLTLPTDAVTRRLWSEVDKTEGCWLWTGYVRNRYGSFQIAGRHVYAHRVSYALAFGSVPAGKHVLHRCDTPRCVRPDHLFLGSPLDNVRDMRAKGRAVNPPTHWGESHPGATLSDEQVAAIRSLRARGIKQRDVASRFGCSQSTVWRITHRRVRVTAATEMLFPAGLA